MPAVLEVRGAEPPPELRLLDERNVDEIDRENGGCPAGVGERESSSSDSPNSASRPGPATCSSHSRALPPSASSTPLRRAIHKGTSTATLNGRIAIESRCRSHIVARIAPQGDRNNLPGVGCCVSLATSQSRVTAVASQRHAAAGVGERKNWRPRTLRSCRPCARATSSWRIRLARSRAPTLASTPASS